MNFKLENILKKIAKENNLSLEQVKEVMDSEFFCTRKVMSQGVHDEPDTFLNINLIKLGKVYAKKGVIEKMKRSKKKKDESK
mgnify:CR=1 FL=1